MRIAALDLGSNSFHLLVCEARLDGSFVPLVREKEMLRLGDQVARTCRIGKEAATVAIEVVAGLKTIAEAHRVDEMIALGTVAIREAEDGAHFVDRVRAETGVEIEVVDGVAEARLIFSAIRASVLIDPAPALAADLGGGSLKGMVGDQRDLSYAASLRLGVGRLTAELVTSDPPSGRDRARLGERGAPSSRPSSARCASSSPGCSSAPRGPSPTSRHGGRPQRRRRAGDDESAERRAPGARRRGAGDLLEHPRRARQAPRRRPEAHRAAPGGDHRPHPPDGGVGSLRAHDQRLGA